MLDASAAVDVLIGNDPDHRLRQVVTADDVTLLTVAHLDAEVLSALARLHRAGGLSADDVEVRLTALNSLRLDRLPITGGLLMAAWTCRDRVAMRDALYVAAAEGVSGRVLTTDDRLRRAAPDHTVGP